MRIDLNNGWLFSKADDFSDRENVRIPHSFVTLPYNYTDEKEYQLVGHYKKTFDYGPKAEGENLYINFDGAAHAAKVFVNGKLIGKHFCGYTAFRLDITKAVKKGENEITVELDARESLNVPPFGNIVDYLTYGGIYREVWLETKNAAHIEDVFVRGDGEKNFAIDFSVVKPKGASIKYEITQNGKIIASGETDAGAAVKGRADEALLWSTDEPNLAALSAELIVGGAIQDKREVVFGFRTAEFRPDGFFLNGKHLKIIGLNRHQSYPYVGYAMPERTQRRDARILKQELGVNAVRTSHYLQSQYFVDECDRLGLLVFTEIPGWQHIGDEKWQKQAVANTADMVKQYRNHPSVVLWGVRINESQDADEFYRETNRVAHALDGSRQTGGVRFLHKSNLLEDVYTFNDFSHEGSNRGTLRRVSVAKGRVPYLVTEFNGHMYPVKAFDDEAQRTEHALRHANVMNSYLGDRDIAGGFGWCMFDYNTHRQFGSGDKICYHGVLDMFRNHKTAAAVYAVNSGKHILEISSTIDRGDYPKSEMGRIYTFTNADSVKLYRNDKYVGEFFPDRKKYPHLAHPPILIDDLLGKTIEDEQGFHSDSAKLVRKIIAFGRKHGPGMVPVRFGAALLLLCAREKIKLQKLVEILLHYGSDAFGGALTYRFDAVKKGEVVKSVFKRSADSVNLDVEADTKTLAEGGTFDVASVRIRALDSFGNLTPYYMEPVELAVSGPLEIIGPRIISLKGGMGGTFVRTTGEKGKGKLTVKGAGGEKEIKFSIE